MTNDQSETRLTPELREMLQYINCSGSSLASSHIDARYAPPQQHDGTSPLPPWADWFINCCGSSLAQSHVGRGNQTLAAEYEASTFNGAELKPLIESDVSSEVMESYRFLFELLEREGALPVDKSAP